MAGGGLHRDVDVHVGLEGFAAGQFPETHRPVGAGHLDQAVFDLEAVPLGPQFVGGHIEQPRPRGGGGVTHRVARLHHRHGTGGEAFIGVDAGLGPLDVDAVVIHIELFRRDHGKRRRNPLADIDLAGVDEDALVFGNLDPLIEAGVGLERCAAGHVTPPRQSDCRWQRAPDDGIRNGTGAGAGLRRFRPRWAWGWNSAAPWRR